MCYAICATHPSPCPPPSISWLPRPPPQAPADAKPTETQCRMTGARRGLELRRRRGEGVDIACRNKDPLPSLRVSSPEQREVPHMYRPRERERQRGEGCAWKEARHTLPSLPPSLTPSSGCYHRRLLPPHNRNAAFGRAPPARPRATGIGVGRRKRGGGGLVDD